MKTSFLVLALAAAQVSADSTSTTYPGRCLTNKDCDAYGSGMACIAVDSATSGLEKLNMCIPTAGSNICSGQIAGVCPTFSAWPSKYRKVQTVCAFLTAPNCNKKIDVKIDGSNGGDANLEPSAGDGSIANPNTTVECYVRNFTDGGSSKVVNGIYQCMDARKYVATNGGHIASLTAKQLAACGAKEGEKEPVLCNGQGTCSPKTPFAQEYECKCNKGFDGDKLCSKVTSNECSNLGQCGALGTCTLTTGKNSGSCTCKNGAKGDQCSLCDGTKSACSGRGKCDAATGACTCDSGYSGTSCADTTTSTNTGGSAAVSSVFAAVSSAALAVAATAALIFA
ncbi:hypothetical protein P43SY_007118 [Pythium insidiosum]|uniref:EGF-like domain-containing protein n=1 Tax=Pythium insidiosum TaxID=114742 RepID=A0AAD5LM10_PYTIN|nr:hypothetical protein P43SY_007118 [Pythium insidiosum]KAJ0407024.1 hypothetical protein ATCC90586_004818 [Pythium insidiosum]